MKLYFKKGACSLIIRIAINELGLSSEFEEVDLKTKQLKNGGDFLAINPKGGVPALQLDNNEILTENAIILQYLADKEKAFKLLPPVGDFDRYRVLETLNFLATDVHKGFGPLFNPKVPKEINAEIFLPILKKKFEHLSKKLNEHKYLMGDEFTLPDIYFFVMLSWFSKQTDLFEWPNLVRYFSELKQRKSIKKSLEDEGIQI